MMKSGDVLPCDDYSPLRAETELWTNEFPATEERPTGLTAASSRRSTYSTHLAALRIKYFKTFANCDGQPLNVEEWIGKVDIPDEPYENEPPQYIQTGAVKKDEDRVRSAINAWIIQASNPGVGHSEFWRLACRLAAAHCAEHEIHSILLSRLSSLAIHGNVGKRYRGS